MLQKIKKNYFLLISTLLILYFFFNLLDGERGLFSYFKKKTILIYLQNKEIDLLNKIKEPIVCVKCSNEFTAGQTDSISLQDYQKVDVGFTERGLQIWCQRHQLNICHINFEGHKLKSDLRCLEKKS